MRKILLTFILLFCGFSLANADQDLPTQESFIEKGVVTAVLSNKHDTDLERVFDSEQVVQILNVKVLTGDLKDKEIKIKNYITSNPAYDVKVKKGDRVILESNDDQEAIDNDSNSQQAKKEDQDEEDIDDINIIAKDNSPIIFIMTGLFLLALLIIGGYKGMKTLVSLGFTIILIIFVLLPGILGGWPPIPATVCVAIASVLITSFLTGGINLKSICTSLGVTISLILAGILSSFVLSATSINGIDSQECLALLGEHPELNFTGILTSAFIISTLGAILAVADKVSKNVHKSCEKKPDSDFMTLFKSGITSTKELTGTMANTLIFAYLGNAIPLLLLSFGTPFIKFINFNVVITEISAAIVGGIAIICCTPITAAISAYLNRKFAK
jgi:uncharacterized membrane protein